MKKVIISDADKEGVVVLRQLGVSLTCLSEGLGISAGTIRAALYNHGVSISNDRDTSGMNNITEEQVRGAFEETKQRLDLYHLEKRKLYNDYQREEEEIERSKDEFFASLKRSLVIMNNDNPIRKRNDEEED